MRNGALKARYAMSLLRPGQRSFFVEKGYVQIPGAAPADKVSAALRAINHSIGAVGPTGGDPAAFQGNSFCFELRRAAAVLDLFNATPVYALAEALLGRGNVQRLAEAQIAPRFPLPAGVAPPPLAGHLDATGTGSNGQPAGSYVRDFSLIVAIYLTDVPGPYGGNFTVWPGSHIETRDFFRRVGHAVLQDGDPDIPLAAAPAMLTGRAGDVILAHHLLQHAGGPNASPHVRHAVIGRLKHQNVACLDKEGFVEMWQEFEGVADLTRPYA